MTSTRKHVARRALALCAFVLLASGVYAQPPSAPTVQLRPGITLGPATDGITEYDLANGLKVLLLPDDSADTITTNVTYLVGSRQEGYGESGMAHLLEHMLFKGTPTHSDIKSELTRRGARYNGSTSYDRTNYFETFPATTANLDYMLTLESDRMVNSKIAASDLASEMTVVRNEYEAGENSPFRVLLERMAATAYIWHAYGRSVIGARSDIEDVPIERLQAFYRNYYQPDDAILVIAGRFDPQHALDEVARTFGAIPRPTRVLQGTYTVEPGQDGERRVVLRRVGDVQVVAAMYHIPAGTDPDYPAVEVLTQLLASEPTGRLHKALVATGKAATTFGSERQLREAGTAYFGASLPKDGSLDAARGALLEVLDGFAAHPVTEEELERARTSLMSEFDKLTSDTRSLAIALSEFAALGDWRYLFLYRDRVARVTRDDVQRVALAYLKPQNRTLGLFIPTDKPDRAEIPPVPNIAEVMKGYHPGAAVAAGEAFDPSPENIDRRTLLKTLPNGIKVALLPKKTRSERVVAQISLHWGQEATLNNRGVACGAASAMLPRGTLKRTRAEINDALDKLHARANVSMDGAAIDTTRPNLAATLKLAAEMLREPSFPADEFEQLRREALESIDAQKSDPGSLAYTSLIRHLSPYPQSHALYTPSIDESEARWKAVTLADARRCYSDYLGATGADIAVVGDFDPKEVAKALRDAFADWKSPSKYIRIPTRYFDVPSEKRTIETPDKANAVYRAALNIKLRDTDPDYPAVLLGDYVIGGSSGSRLWARVREKEGLSYDVRSSLVVGPLDEAGQFSVSAIYAPQNRDRVERAINEELARALRYGFTDQELKSAKHGLLEARRVARTQDRTIAWDWVHYLYLGRTFAWDKELDEKINALTVPDVLAALRRHIDPAAMSAVLAGDFASVARHSTGSDQTPAATAASK